MMTDITVTIPDNALLFEVAQQAISRHLHLICDGRDFRLSPVVPAGWHKMAVGFKTRMPESAQ